MTGATKAHHNNRSLVFSLPRGQALGMTMRWYSQDNLVGIQPSVVP